MEHICYSLLRLKMLSEIFCFLYCKIYGNNYILSVILKSDFFKKLFFGFFHAGNPAKCNFNLEKYTCNERIMNCIMILHNCTI